MMAKDQWVVDWEEWRNNEWVSNTTEPMSGQDAAARYHLLTDPRRTKRPTRNVVVKAAEQQP